MITSSSSDKEGPGFKVRIKIKNADPGTITYWQATETASDRDLINEATGDALDGPAILDSDGNAIIKLFAIKNLLTEGLENFRAQAFTDSDYLNPVGNIFSVDMNSWTPELELDRDIKKPAPEDRLDLTSAGDQPTAAAPPATSRISWVMAAWRALL